MKTISNSAFDYIKWVCIFGLHLIGVAYGQLADIWALPYSQAIPETLDIIGVLLGAFLAWETYQYKKEYDIFTAPKVQPVADASPILPEDLTVEVKREEIE